MAITRVVFNTTASDSGAYSVALNPSKISPVGHEHNLLRTLDAGQIIQDTFFDARPIVLSWSGIQKGLISGFSTMLTTLNGYRGSIRYLNFKDIEPRINATGWIKTRVTDFKSEFSSGGILKYNVEMVLTPEPE